MSIWTLAGKPIAVLRSRRRRQRDGQVALAIGLTVEAYQHGLVRMRIAERIGHRSEVELTCTTDEIPTLVTWAVRFSGATHVTALPVAEHTQRPWGPEYRWTRAAHDVYRAARIEAA